MCIPPILIVNHFAVDTIFKSFIYLLCTKLLPILYGWSLYKMHKGVIFENLLKDLLINFVNKLKIWISREFCFLFQASYVLMKYWRIEESGVACWNAKFMLLFWHFLLSKEPNLTNTCTFAEKKAKCIFLGTFRNVELKRISDIFTQTFVFPYTIYRKIGTKISRFIDQKSTFSLSKYVKKII